MATLDELDNRLRVVERDLSSSQSQVDNLADDVHNLGTRMDSAETKLNNHEQRIQTLEMKVEKKTKLMGISIILLIYYIM